MDPHLPSLPRRRRLHSLDGDELHGALRFGGRDLGRDAVFRGGFRERCRAKHGKTRGKAIGNSRKMEVDPLVN